jgi:hypothetical protein
MGRLDWKTSPSYPDGVPTCRVTGTVVVPRADGVDADLVPDVDAFVGVIRFTPNVESQIRVLDAVEPLIFAPTVVEARFNGAGQVFGVDGVPGVVLPSSLSDRLSPSWSTRITMTSPARTSWFSPTRSSRTPARSPMATRSSC